MFAPIVLTDAIIDRASRSRSTHQSWERAIVLRRERNERMEIVRQIIASSEAAVAVTVVISIKAVRSTLDRVAHSLSGLVGRLVGWLVGALPAAPLRCCYLNRFIYMVITGLIGRKSTTQLRLELCRSRHF